MTSNTDILAGGSAVSSASRWVQLGLGIICMMAISSPQYVWALFTKPLGAALSVSPAALQVTFSLLIVLQTFFSPLQGWLVDRFGPRLLIAVGAALSGLGWVLSAYATSLWALYLSYGVICGIGTGIVYIGVVGQVVRWFPDARGFAAGMVAAGYGMGAIVTTFPISASIASSGHQATLKQYGIIFAIVGVAAALGLRRAPASAVASTSAAAGVDSRTMLKSPIFLADVRDDVADVDLGAHGDLADRQFCSRFRHYQADGVGHGRLAAGTDDRPFHQWLDPPVFSAGCPIGSAARTRCSSPSRSKRRR